MNKLRDDLPPVPYRMKDLPVDRGYPVPWFVPFIDGKPEFRMADEQKVLLALRDKLCWLCGQPLGSFLSFVIGPMCTVNRVSAEPPQHRECSKFSVRACPFLLGKQLERREGGLPEVTGKPAGVMIARNPGVSAIWTSRGVTAEQHERGFLFRLWEPTEVLWFAKGRAATREEVLASVETGLPILMDMAQQEGSEAVAELNRMCGVAEQFYPKAA